MGGRGDEHLGTYVYVWNSNTGHLARYCFIPHHRREQAMKKRFADWLLLALVGLIAAASVWTAVEVTRLVRNGMEIEWVEDVE